VNTTGKLLIATPAIGEGEFEQSVILMLHHDSEGAVGVIINEPTELLVDELLPRWSDLTTAPAVFFTGGPVQEDGFVGVGRAIEIGAVGDTPSALDQDQDALRVPGTAVVTVDLGQDPALAAAEIDQLRIFRGYSGWGPHQLDTELAAGAWFTVESEPGDVWSAEPEGLYEQVLLRQQGDLRWFANAPTDPSQN